MVARWGVPVALVNTERPANTAGKQWIATMQKEKQVKKMPIPGGYEVNVYAWLGRDVCLTDDLEALYDKKKQKEVCRYGIKGREKLTGRTAMFFAKQNEVPQGKRKNLSIVPYDHAVEELSRFVKRAPVDIGDGLTAYVVNGHRYVNTATAAKILGIACDAKNVSKAVRMTGLAPAHRKVSTEVTKAYGIGRGVGLVWSLSTVYMKAEESNKAATMARVQKVAEAKAAVDARTSESTDTTKQLERLAALVERIAQELGIDV